MDDDREAQMPHQEQDPANFRPDEGIISELPDLEKHVKESGLDIEAALKKPVPHLKQISPDEPPTPTAQIRQRPSRPHTPRK